MKIHLIKDGDVSNETFTEVFDLLNALDGPIQFFCDNDNLIDFSEDDYVENIILNQDKFEKGIKKIAHKKSNYHIHCEFLVL